MPWMGSGLLFRRQPGGLESSGPLDQGLEPESRLVGEFTRLFSTSVFAIRL